MGSYLFCHLAVPFKIPRVILEIFVGGELGGIDEEADDEKISLPSTLPHKAEVALVKETHRRDKCNPLPRPSGLGRKCFHLFDRLDDFHFFQIRIVDRTIG